MATIERGRVAHAVPGRVRVRLETRALADDRSSELRRALLTVPDVEEVQITPRTGSVVIVYDPEALDTHGLIDSLRRARLLALDPPTDDPYAGRGLPLSETARGIRRTFHGANVRLSEITNGRWDLRSVLPFALGALAIRQFVADSGALGAAPWYVLAWYAFDSFWKLNQEHVVVENDDDLLDETDE